MNTILGDKDVCFYINWLVFALLGFIIQKYILFVKRNDKTKFNLKYFFRDNKIDIILGFIISFVAARFHQELIDSFKLTDPSNGNVMFRALLFGFFYTTIIQFIRKTKIGKIIKSDSNSTGGKR